MDALTDQLVKRGILLLAYYEESGRCRFIKCIDKKSGEIFLLQVSELDLRAPEEGYKTSLTRLDAVPIIEDSYSLSAIDMDDKFDAYESIYMDPKQNAYKIVYEQIVRIGHCFRKLELKPLIEYETIVCQMRPDNSLCWFRTNVATTNWNIVVPMGSIGSVDLLRTISDKLFNILLETRERQIYQVMAPSISAGIISRIKAVKAADEVSFSARAKLSHSLQLLSERERALQDKRDMLPKVKTSQNVLSSRDINLQLDETRQLLYQTVQHMEKNAVELKANLLENERVFYSLFKSVQPFM